MEIKGKIKQLITALLNNIRERRKVILALSCLVVFFTTYLLILPAFTLDKEEAAEQGGIDVPGVEQSVDADETVKEPAVSEPAKTAPKEAAKTDVKKKSADVTLKNDESDDFSVAVESKDAVLSEDMSVAVREIDQSDKKQKEEYDSLYNDALEAVQKAEKKEGLEKPSDFAFAKFYDISLKDGDDEVEPESAVDVKISFSKDLQKELKVTDTKRVHIVHFAVDKETGEVTPEVLDTDTTDIKVKNNKVTEANFTADSFSVFAVVYTTLEKTYISASGDTYDIKVTYDETAEIPDNAELEVREIAADSKEYKENVSAANKEIASQNMGEFVDPVQFDISIVADGKEIEPKEGSTVSVEIRLEKSLFEKNDNEDAKNREKEAGILIFNGEEVTSDPSEISGCMIAHIADNGTAEIIEGVSSSVIDSEIVMNFETDSFSDYMVQNNNSFWNLPNTIYVGDVIYFQNAGNTYITGLNSANSPVTETKHNNQDSYKTVEAVRSGTFRICDSSNWNNGNPRTGTYKEITVLPERTGTTPLPPVIDTVDNSSIGLTLNLFDYDIGGYLNDRFNNYDYAGNNPGSYQNNVLNAFLNYGINNGHSLKFWGSGITNGRHGSLNNYVEHGVTSIVKNTTDTGEAGGYPVLSTDNTSLDYLFTPSSDGDNKQAYTNVNGLFKKDGDYYVYDSNTNYAWYNPSTNSFDVYNTTYFQHSGSESGGYHTPDPKPIGFFPFHKYDKDYDLYVNWNKHLNHHFGMSMSVDFSLPKDPKAVVDTNNQPIIFEFSGDDDMWVFIDGKLVMDIGGIHQPTSGTINFQTGTVTVNGSEQMNNSTFNSRFPNIYDGNKHTLQVFYIERGGCDSNCMIKFNLTQYGDIHFDKVDKDNQSDKLKGAVFGIYKDASCTTPLMENLKDGTSRAYVAESDAQGHVQFSDIPIGTYYLKELHAPEGYPLDDTVHTVQVYIDQNTQTVKVKVTIDGADVEAGVKILNEKPAPINLGLRKAWQNTDGESITAPEGATATFELKRIRSYETYDETPIDGSGRDVSHLVVGIIHDGESHIYKEYDLISGTRATISWSYKEGYQGSKDCIVNGTRIDKDYTSGNVVSQDIIMPAAGQNATIYIVDESENGEAISGINTAGSTFYGNEGGGVIHEFRTVTEQDSDFNYTGENVTDNKVTLPINSNTWAFDFTDLPTFGRGSVVVQGSTRVVAFNYSYYLEEVDSTCPDGTTVIYTDLEGNVINTPTAAETSQSGTLNITNKVPTGYLRIDKEVTYNGVSPVPDGKKSALAGTYTFKVYTDSDCSKPYKVIQGEAPNQQEVDLELTVTIGEDGVGKSSDTVKLPVGDYWIQEQTPSQTGVTPEENPIKVTIEADQTTAEPAVASFTNNKEESDNPDELAIELEKTFIGLPNASKIPRGYQAVLTYTYNGSTVTVPLTGSSVGNVTCVKSDDGMIWHWRVTQIPKTATNFGVYESNYDITGYTRITKINGNVVDNPESPQGVTVLVPQITMTNITSDYTTTDNNKVFTVADNQILLVRMTNHATVVVSQKSLSWATRQAIEKTLRDNGGKVPGDNSAQAQWVMNFVYFSHEIQGDSFSYGGRTIYFNGNEVRIPHKSSSHEVRADIGYTSTSAENSFTIENSYTEVPTEVDVLKVEKGKETTTQLPGAVFELRKLEDVAPASPGETLTYVEDENDHVIVTSKTTLDNGRLTFTDLTYGEYEIREVTPPPGYIMEEEVIFYLRVDGGVISYIQKGDGKPSEWRAATNPDATGTVYFTEKNNTVDSPVNATFTVGNTPGAELPHTGGIGTTIFYILGTILVLGCGIYFIARRRISN